MLDQTLTDDRARARDDLEQPFRDSGLERELTEADRSERGQFGGFSTTALPAASAGANAQEAIVMGKFQGTMTPTTP